MPVMPLFVDPETLIERMQLDSGTTGVLPEVTKALFRSQIFVEMKLGGALTRRSWRSMFYLDPEAFSGIQPGGMFRLELSSSLLRKDTAPVVSCSSVQEPDALNPFAPLDAADPAKYQIDYPRGFVLMDAREFGGRYVKVEYDTGLEPGTNPAPITGLPLYGPGTTYQAGESVNLNGVSWTAEQEALGIEPSDSNPSWSRTLVPQEEPPANIAEAILGYAPTILDAQASKDRESERVTKFDQADSFLQDLLEPYRRACGFSFRPLWSE